MQDASARSRVSAVLGPTNTGKTHFAIERLLAHRSGMIGFPLRLLARENFDRVVREKGAAAAALITGEERIVPPNPSYFLCTVESMPLDLRVEFLAIDEVQLAADPERGHIFTDRLLHARGSEETMLLGSDTVRRLVKRLVPEAEIISRPRLSRLSWAGQKKITRLPPRSAVVAFSAAGVYSLAELMRRRRGGTAVVLGALSPRTRNAQVAMYQEGDVDYMVATDAIGMGLNMDVRHVAFSSLVKFDGRTPRHLSPPEIAQIAGRAGRHTRDGTFGTTGDAGVPEPEVIARIEDHEFDPARFLFWRNGELDFASPRALLASLEMPPPERFLRRARDADDHRALAALAGHEDIAAMAAGQPAVRLLWDVCQVPDFRKILSDYHTRLLGQIYRYLMRNDGRLPAAWVEGHVRRLDRTDGEFDTLIGRIAHIRTWTYVSHRPGWLDDAAGWQERARDIEDRLSDALHERLTQRFVDRRAATLVRRMREDEPLMAAVRRDGDVLVEGEYVGRLDGFRFRLDAEAVPDDARALTNAALRALRGDVEARVRRLEGEGRRAFGLDEAGRLTWRGAPVGRLRSGPDALTPSVEPLASELLDPALRDRVRACLARWLESRIRTIFAPLLAAGEADLPGPARGLVYRLSECLGSLPRRDVADLVGALARADRRRLGELGVRIGAASVYVPALVRPEAVALRAVLAAAHRGQVAAAPAGASCAIDPIVPESFYEACGYRIADGLAVRVDRLEKLAGEARRLARQGPFAATEGLAATAGCKVDELPPLLALLGYRECRDEAGTTFVPRRRPARQGRKAKRADKAIAKPGAPKTGRTPSARRAAYDPDSPFAKLRELMVS